MAFFRRCPQASAKSCAHCSNLPPLRARYFLERELPNGNFYTPIPAMYRGRDVPFKKLSCEEASTGPAQTALPLTGVEAIPESVEIEEVVRTFEASVDRTVAEEEPVSAFHYLSFIELQQRQHVDWPTDFARPSGGNIRCPVCGMLCLSQNELNDHHGKLHPGMKAAQEAQEKKKNPRWKAFETTASQDPESAQGITCRLQLRSKNELLAIASAADLSVPKAAPKTLLVGLLSAKKSRILEPLANIETGATTKRKFNAEQLGTAKKAKTKTR